MSVCLCVCVCVCVVVVVVGGGGGVVGFVSFFFSFFFPLREQTELMEIINLILDELN